MKKEIQVTWREEGKTLTLEGEPVLEYTLAWPQVEEGGLSGRWISRYYVHLAKGWRQRWEREVYWLACLELAARREAARPFTPWKGELKGETVLFQDGLLSLRFHGSEVRGNGRPARVRWGDVWTVHEGAPKSLRSLFAGEKGWRSRLWQGIIQQGEERRRSGDCFLDGDWMKKAKAAHPFRDWCLTGEGIEVSLPQCAASPAEEGCPVFTLPLTKE